MPMPILKSRDILSIPGPTLETCLSSLIIPPLQQGKLNRAIGDLRATAGRSLGGLAKKDKTVPSVPTEVGQDVLVTPSGDTVHFAIKVPEDDNNPKLPFSRYLDQGAEGHFKLAKVEDLQRRREYSKKVTMLFPCCLLNIPRIVQVYHQKVRQHMHRTFSRRFHIILRIFIEGDT